MGSSELPSPGTAERLRAYKAMVDIDKIDPATPAEIIGTNAILSEDAMADLCRFNTEHPDVTSDSIQIAKTRSRLQGRVQFAREILEEFEQHHIAQAAEDNARIRVESESSRGGGT